MRTFLRVFYWTFVILTVQGCVTTPNPNEAKAKQILNEINEDAQKSLGEPEKQQIMEAMSRFNQEKERFPEGRDQIMADARLGKQFFGSAVDGHKHTIELLEQLLTLPISETDSSCVQKSIQTNNAQIDQMELTIKQMDIFLDESIVDKQDLDSKLLQLRKDSEAAQVKFYGLTGEQRDLCSKSKLGIK